jgi:hypothetical protein
MLIATAQRHGHPHPKNLPRSRIQVGMYSYGAPRVGNHNFARDYNLFVPNSFRVGLLCPPPPSIWLTSHSHSPIASPLPPLWAVVDGDIVSGVPSSGYKHIGTNVIVDSKGKGSIIIDPSFVEKYLRMSSKTSIGAHSLNVYRRGLKGVKLATLYLNGKLDETQRQNVFRMEEEERERGGGEGGHHVEDGIALTSTAIMTRSKRSSSAFTTGIANRTSSTSSLNASVMRIAQESSAYVASYLDDEDQKRREEEEGEEDMKEDSMKGEEKADEDDPELKRHNQEVTNIDAWAAEMQNSTYFEKFLIWIGFGKANEEDEDRPPPPGTAIAASSPATAADPRILDLTSNVLHQDSQITGEGEEGQSGE